MKTDLHVHTYYSDGTCSPAEALALARRAGVELISLTDHDSLEGDEVKLQAARAAGILAVSGWEVSSYCKLGKVHMLGYHCARNSTYDTFLAARKAGSLHRAEYAIQKINELLSLSLTIEDAERQRKKAETPIHIMHVVRAVAEVLHKDESEIFFNYFAYGKPAYSELGRPSPTEALQVIHACGGLAVLAHPGRIAGSFSVREKLMDELCELGLDGIECYYTTHTASETEYFRAYAKKHGLLVTGGSDFHSPNRGREIGVPAFEADDRLLFALGLRF